MPQPGTGTPRPSAPLIPYDTDCTEVAHVRVSRPRQGAGPKGLAQGKQKVDEVQQNRAGTELLKAGRRVLRRTAGSGSPEATQDALNTLEAHVNAHGDAFLHD